MTVGGDRARPGHLHVTTLADAGHAGRPHTFVIGLEEGGVFPTLMEDPVLLDAERKGIDQALRTSEDRVGEALYRIVSRLGSLGGHVCLSYSCRDLRQARIESAASRRDPATCWRRARSSSTAPLAASPSADSAFRCRARSTSCL